MLLDKPQFLIDLVEPFADFLLVVLHAVGFVEQPDDVNPGLAHQADQLLGHLAERRPVAFDDPPGLAGDLSRSQILTDDVQSGDRHDTDVHPDVRFPQAFRLIQLLLGDHGTGGATSPGDSRRHGTGHVIHRLRRFGGLFHFLRELLLNPFLVKH